MSAAVDPGRAIQWARTPALSVRLVEHLRALGTDRATAVLSPAAGLRGQRREQRMGDVAGLAAALFVDGGDLAKRARHERSVAARIRK